MAAPPAPAGGSPRRGRHRLHPDQPVTRRRVGDPTGRGQLDKPVGAFRLAEGLTAPGAINADDALALVVADWQRQVSAGNLAVETAKNYRSRVGGLVGFAAGRGVVMLADFDARLTQQWLHAPVRRKDGVLAEPTIGSRFIRRSSARAFFQTTTCLGLWDENPARVTEEVRKTPRHVRPLTTGQIEQLKIGSYARAGDTKAPALLALIMQGAATGEVAYIRVRDLDLVHERVWVHNPGSIHRDRWVSIRDPWSLTALTARAAWLADQTESTLPPGITDPQERPLVYDRRRIDLAPGAMSAAIAMAANKMMKTARVSQPGVLRVESIREWVAAQVFVETGRVETVALRLGMSSLDAAAHLVGYDWVAAAAGTAPGDSPPAGLRLLPTPDSTG